MALANPSSTPAPEKEASGWDREAGRPCKRHTHVDVHTEEASFQEGEDEAAAAQLQLTSSGYF